MFSDDLMQEAEKDELETVNTFFLFFCRHCLMNRASLTYQYKLVPLIQEDFGSHTPHWEDKSATIEVSDVYMIYGLIAKAYKVSKYYDNNPNC